MVGATTIGQIQSSRLSRQVYKVNSSNCFNFVPQLDLYFIIVVSPYDSDSHFSMSALSKLEAAGIEVYVNN